MNESSSAGTKTTTRQDGREASVSGETTCGLGRKADDDDAAGARGRRRAAARESDGAELGRARSSVAIARMAFEG